MTDWEQLTLVRLGELVVATKRGTLAALGLGSCVAVLIHDASRQIGGLAHVLLPSRSLCRNRNKPVRSADAAVPLLVSKMIEAGAERTRLESRLVGGASMFADLMARGAVHIGERNLAACRLALRSEGVEVTAEAVGGETSRSVWFDVRSGVVKVRSPYGEPVQI
ncbi:MAG: chemotaxis protein CheD [Gemmatimonadales bacterium]